MDAATMATWTAALVRGAEVAAWTSAVALVLFLVFVYVCRRYVFGSRSGNTSNTVSIAFFHPYCNSGGGGERVLWQGLHSLRSLGDTDPQVPIEFVIYSGDPDISFNDAKAAVLKRFGIDLSESGSAATIKFVYVTRRRLLEASNYPRFTMLGQSLGSMLLAWECVRAYTPDVFFDTTGWAFTYFVAKVLARCKVISYTHYPTITSDMLNRVHERRPTYNNDANISNSALKTAVKVVYYRIFAVFYAIMGRFVDVCMCNSAWTRGHLRALWGGARELHVVAPPCNTEALQALPAVERKPWVLSVGQFRPEKDHRLQLRAFKALTELGEYKDARLVLLGGCRSADDEALVDELKALAKELGIQDQTEFRVNAPFEDLKSLLASCSVGIHTMWNEHFGIGVVEMMAAGMVVVAHNSGGPKSDIVVEYDGEATGFLATTPEEYAKDIASVLDEEVDVDRMREVARESVAHRFSDDEFSLSFFAQVVGVYQSVVESKAGGKAKLS